MWNEGKKAEQSQRSEMAPRSTFATCGLHFMVALTSEIVEALYVSKTQSQNIIASLTNKAQE